MADLDVVDVVYANGICVIRVTRLATDFDIFTNGSISVIESASDDLGIQYTIQLIVLVDIIIKVLYTSSALKEE